MQPPQQAQPPQQVQQPVQQAQQQAQQQQIEYLNMNPNQQMAIMLFAEGIKRKGIKTFKKDAADIANVMKNRVERGFGDSITEVLTAPYQFSGLGSSEFKKALTGNLTDEEEKMFKEALRISKGVMLGTIKDKTGGADHYYNPDVVKKDPSWSKVYSKTKDGVAHRFFNSRNPVKKKPKDNRKDYKQQQINDLLYNGEKKEGKFDDASSKARK